MQSDSPKRSGRDKSKGGPNNPGESSKESEATSDKTMETSRLRVLAVPLSSTTRADRSQKKGTNRYLLFLSIISWYYLFLFSYVFSVNSRSS